MWVIRPLWVPFDHVPQVPLCESTDAVQVRLVGVHWGR